MAANGSSASDIITYVGVPLAVLGGKTLMTGTSTGMNHIAHAVHT